MMMMKKTECSCFVMPRAFVLWSRQCVGPFGLAIFRRRHCSEELDIFAAVLSVSTMEQVCREYIEENAA